LGKQPNTADWITLLKRHGIALSHFWSLDGLAQHRNNDAHSYYTPQNRENATNERYPSDVWLEKEDSRQVRSESNWQKDKQQISEKGVPDQRQSDKPRYLHLGWTLRAHPPGADTAERSYDSNYL
jgi:hypothetical protein